MDPTVFEQHEDLEQRHWWFTARAQIVRKVIDRVLDPAEPETLIVDVGCGTGGMVHALTGDRRVLGIDSSEIAIEKARSLYPASEYYCGDVFSDQTEIGHVGMFMLMDVLEHIEDDRGFFTRLVDRLPEGGKVLITVPADMSLWSEHDVLAHHQRRYDRAGLEAVWSGLPVRVLSLSAFNARLYFVVKSVRFLKRVLGLNDGKSGSDFFIPPWPLNGLLHRLFAGEATRLLSTFDSPDAHGYRQGVSLMAVLEKQRGEPRS